AARGAPGRARDAPGGARGARSGSPNGGRGTGLKKTRAAVSGAGSLSVGLLHFTAPPIVGGVEAIIGHQAAGLVRRGHRVRVLAGRGGAFHPDVEFVHLPRLDSKYPPLLALKGSLEAGRLPPEFELLSTAIESEP